MALSEEHGARLWMGVRFLVRSNEEREGRQGTKKEANGKTLRIRKDAKGLGLPCTVDARGASFLKRAQC
jgi:hypothetical protein